MRPFRIPDEHSHTFISVTNLLSVNLTYIYQLTLKVIHPEGFTIDRPHGSGDYLFLMFRSTMEIQLQGQRIIADKNTYIIYKKSSLQFYRGAGCPMIHDWFHFEMEDAEDFFSQLNLPFDTLIRALDMVYRGSACREAAAQPVAFPAYVQADLRNSGHG